MHTRTLTNRERWNEAINQRRASGKPAFQKGHFDPRSPGYSLPKDVLQHPTVQAVEQFFVDQRERELNPEQLTALNGVQNDMRNKLARFSAMHHVYDYKVVVPMHEFAAQAEEMDGNDDKSLSWKVVHIAATTYLQRANDVLGLN